MEASQGKMKLTLKFNMISFLFLGLSHMDGFPEDLKEVVNEHWAQFPPQNYAVVYFFGVCFTILTFVNILTNSFIIYIYLSNKDLCIPVSEHSCIHFYNNFYISRPIC